MRVTGVLAKTSQNWGWLGEAARGYEKAAIGASLSLMEGSAYYADKAILHASTACLLLLSPDTESCGVIVGFFVDYLLKAKSLCRPLSLAGLRNYRFMGCAAAKALMAL